MWTDGHMKFHLVCRLILPLVFFCYPSSSMYLFSTAQPFDSGIELSRTSYLHGTAVVTGAKMLGAIRSRFTSGRLMQTWSSSRPSDALRGKIAELQTARRKRRDPRRDEFMVDVPESKSYLDTATMPMILTAVAVALFAKVLMTVDDSKEQERIERKIQKAPLETGTVRMLTREEWDAIQEIRPRTPFESKFARPNARIRTDEPLRMEDVKDWTIDVLTDAFSRVEDSIKHNPK